MWKARPDVPDVGEHDILTYLQGLGPGAAFHSIREWERLTGRRLDAVRRGEQPDGLARGPVRASTAADGDAYRAWRASLRAIFRQVLDDNGLDGLFFPQAAAPNRDLVEDPARPDFAPNDWPEIPSNIVNALGVPVVTVPGRILRGRNAVRRRVHRDHVERSRASA